MDTEQNFGMVLEVFDANAPEDPDIAAMRDGVDGDGLIHDQPIETRYCEIKGAIPTENYLRIIGDDGFTDVEIRILRKTLEALGWRRQREPNSEPRSECCNAFVTFAADGPICTECDKWTTIKSGVSP